MSEFYFTFVLVCFKRGKEHEVGCGEEAEYDRNVLYKNILKINKIKIPM